MDGLEAQRDASRVLVVDDEPSLVDAVATALRYEGFDVIEATTGRAGLAAARDVRPDLIVLDVMLPDLDGFAVSTRLREDGISSPVLFLTARDSLDDKAHGFAVANGIPVPASRCRHRPDVSTGIRTMDPAPDGLGTHHVEFVMGMAVSIDIRDHDAPAAALVDVIEWLHHVDDTFSTHQTESPISAIGRGELSLDDAGDEIRGVLRLCEHLRRDSDGAFDAFEVPAPNGTRFDPSGVVKGWSIDRAADILEQHGCVNFCINAGGDIAVRGNPVGDQPWRVGIRHPDVAQSLALVINASGRVGIATSATYERGAHIIDPRTGQYTTDLASVTIVGPDLTLADAYATTVFVMGLDGLGWLANHTGYDAYVITHDDMTYWTDGFAQYRSPG